MKRYTLIYLLTFLVFGSGIYIAIRAGTRLERLRPAAVATNPDPAQQPATASSGVLKPFTENIREPLSLLLVQLIVIVLLARGFGWAFARMGQPAVIGEMIAGIVLGPSLLGMAFPDAFSFVFPANSLGTLRILSQVGVILFMFMVGMELDLRQVRKKANAAVMISHVSIIFPYFLGVATSYFIFEKFAPAGTSFLPFALFMGISMSITAFPVLARIIEERNLTGTYLGSTAITCAAVDDITAWSILAFVVAIAKATSFASSIITVALSIALVAVMFLVFRPFLNRQIAIRPRIAERPGRNIVVGVLVFVFASALCTEVIGIHALFGAFLAGLAMPAFPQFRLHIKERLEHFSAAFLLPLFFAFTGLRTQIGLLNDWQSWMVCLGLIVVATLGKLGGSMLAARYTGMDWGDSFRVGALMNTRGLVELIVLNIGLDLGILSPRVFAMMVIMALVTTFMTGPLLWLAEPARRKGPALAAVAR